MTKSCGWSEGRGRRILPQSINEAPRDAGDKETPPMLRIVEEESEEKAQGDGY